MLFIPVMEKLNFQQPLQYLVSHDPAEIIIICWFGAQKTFLINVKKGVLFWKPSYVFFFRIILQNGNPL